MAGVTIGHRLSCPIIGDQDGARQRRRVPCQEQRGSNGYQHNDTKSGRRRRRALASVALPGLAGHARDTTHVDPNRRQGQAGARALPQRMVGSGLHGDSARPHHLHHPLRPPDLPGRLRLDRPPPGYPRRRRLLALPTPAPPLGGRLLPRVHGSLGGVRNPGADHDQPGGGGEHHSL
jgi:hypothetical protein